MATPLFQKRKFDIKNIKSRYGVTGDVAMFGIHHAISGHDGSFNLDSYVGLIPDEEERRELGRKRRYYGI